MDGTPYNESGKAEISCNYGESATTRAMNRIGRIVSHVIESLFDIF
jgi:hypothetical protein